MTTPSQDDRFAPPQSHVEDVEPDGASKLASRWSRLGAVIIDVLILMALMWVASTITPWNPWAPQAEDFWWSFQFRDALGGFVLNMLANGYLLAVRGQTLGKLALGIRIVRTGGSRASFARLAGLRYGVGQVVNMVPALGTIYGLVDSLFIFHSSRRCLHDRIADTIVIKA